MLDALPPELQAVLAIAVAIVAAYLGGRNATARRKAIKLETMLRDYLRDQFDLPTPRTKQLTAQEVRSAITAAAPADATIDIHTWDGRYIAPVREDINLLRVAGKLLSVFPYRPARFDCEDYGKFFSALVPLVFGVNTAALVVDWDGGHAYNAIVTAEGDVQLYEPNGDRLVTAGESEAYQFQHAEVYL